MGKRSSRGSRNRARDAVLDTSWAITRFLTGCSNAHAKLVNELFVSGNHDQIVNLTVDPTADHDWYEFLEQWQAYQLLQKYPGLNLSVDPKSAAWTAFEQGESQCRTTNARLRAPYDTPTLGVSAESLLWRAREKIRFLLGEFSWDNAEPYMSFSSGASTSRRRTSGDPYFKYRGKLDVTPQAKLLAAVAIHRVPRWRARMTAQFGLDYSSWFNLVPGNEVTTVPKNAKTDRTIAIEPDMNMFLQRGIGGLIRRKLRRVGVDLNDQTWNQMLAREGALHNSFATIDLKMASDTVSVALVERLLPHTWYEAMDSVRSHVGTTRGDGRIVSYQKFSSMGNGFTFELESLIFWALASTVVESLRDSDRRMAVYGDDIIVPKAAAGFLIELLSYVGFTTNETKTFVSGPFRESCGKHYYCGLDVTPFQVKKVLSTESDRYWFANNIRAYAARRTGSPDFACDRLQPTYDKVVRRLIGKKPLRIPDGIGHGGLVSTFAEAAPRMCRRLYAWRFRMKLDGVGLAIETFEDPEAFYLRSVQNRREAKPYPVFSDGHPQQVDASDFRAIQRELGGVSAPPTLCINREKKWSRTVRATTSRWVDAPMWLSIRAWHAGSFL